MATVSRENIGLLNDKLTVQLSKEDYFPAFEQSIKEICKNCKYSWFSKRNGSCKHGKKNARNQCFYR